MNQALVDSRRTLPRRDGRTATARAGGSRTSPSGAVAASDTQTDGFRTWWPSLARSADDLWNRQRSGSEGGWQVMEDLQRWLLVRRMHTKRQVAELMTDFWMNHLNVPINGDATFTHRIGFDATIRANALGRFDELPLVPWI